MKNKTYIFAVAAALGVVASFPIPAHADASCPALMSTISNTLHASRGYYNIEMTMHRTDVAFVSYSNGTIESNGANAVWPLTGQANQLFSDRTQGSQPFNSNAADQLSIWIGASGQLFISYNTWHFSTSWDMSCTGNAMTKIIPGVGVVTLTFRNWSATIG